MSTIEKNVRDRLSIDHQGRACFLVTPGAYYAGAPTTLSEAVDIVTERLTAFHRGNFHTPEMGDPCPRCQCGTISGRQTGGGKVGLWTSCCGRITKGHDKVREKGPEPVKTAKVTNLRPLHRIYGHSYFGSGGGYGRVTCCDNCEVVGTNDNGFMSGPAAVRVKDYRRPATFVAKGGDSIGSNGREWGESSTWNPSTRRWE